jgi:type 1 glutamine amidotransferase
MNTTRIAFAGAFFLAAVCSSTFAAAAAPLRVLMVTGGCCHNYSAQAAALKAGLESRANLTLDVVYNPATGTDTTFELYRTADWSRGYDLVIHNECSASVTDLDYIRNILAPHAAGLPAVFIHCAMHSFRTDGWNTGTVTPWYEFTGLQTSGHGAQLPIEVSFVDNGSAITRGLETWTTSNDELYNNYTGGILPTAHPIALGRQGSAQTVIAWTNLYKERARTFGTTLGHNNAVLEEPKMLDLLTRGLLWAADRLNDDYLKPAPAATAEAPGTNTTPETSALPTTIPTATEECSCGMSEEIS